MRTLPLSRNLVILILSLQAHTATLESSHRFGNLQSNIEVQHDIKQQEGHIGIIGEVHEAANVNEDLGKMAAEENNLINYKASTGEGSLHCETLDEYNYAVIEIVIGDEKSEENGDEQVVTTATPEKQSIRKRKSAHVGMSSQEKYKIRRDKNNEASRSSREKRKVKRTMVEKRAAELEEENEQLEKRVEELEAEVKQIRTLLIQRLTNSGS